MIDLIYINLAIIYIVEISGITESIKRAVWRVVFPRLKYRPFSAKPFDCSVCLTFWFTLFYSYFWNCNDFSLSLFLAATISYLSRFVTKFFKLLLLWII